MSELPLSASPSAKPAAIGPLSPLSSPQTVQFQLLEEDYLAAGQYTHEHSPEVVSLQQKHGRRWSVVGLVMTTNACLAHLFLPAAPAFLKLTLLIVGLTLLLLAAIYPLRVKRLIRRRMKRYVSSDALPLPDVMRSVTISRDGVATDEPYISSLIGWPAIEQVKITSTHLFLFWRPLAPITVPLRAFASADCFQAYCQLAERLWEEQRLPKCTQ